MSVYCKSSYPHLTTHTCLFTASYSHLRVGPLVLLHEDLGLPLVSMSPRDVMLGRRKIILSLVYQLMRFHTLQVAPGTTQGGGMLEGIAATPTQQQQQPQQVPGLSQQQWPSHNTLPALARDAGTGLW